MGRVVAAALVLLMLAPAAWADDDWIGWPNDDDARVRSGARTSVARAGRRGATIEEQIPDDGPYARGVRLDAEGRHGEALRAFIDAVAEESGVADVASGAGGCRAARRAKLIWQREASDRLLEQEAYVAVMPRSALAHYHLASAQHAKFLAIRAFLGRAPRSLWDKARAGYLRAIELDRTFHGTRARLAALYAQAGKTREARLELAALGARSDDPALAFQLSAVYAALGDLDAAFELLGRGELFPEERSDLVRANDFDPLRADPRFARLVGGGWTSCD